MEYYEFFVMLKKGHEELRMILQKGAQSECKLVESCPIVEWHFDQEDIRKMDVKLAMVYGFQ